MSRIRAFGAEFKGAVVRILTEVTTSSDIENNEPTGDSVLFEKTREQITWSWKVQEANPYALWMLFWLRISKYKNPFPFKDILPKRAICILTMKSGKMKLKTTSIVMITERERKQKYEN